MNSDNSEEIFPVVDAAGNVVGKATRGECHGGSMLLHPVVHLHVFNSRGELYLQKRPAWKDIQPGRWDTAVGGHVDYGETIAEALRREVREELGITEFTPEAVAVYEFRSEREREVREELGITDFVPGAVAVYPFRSEREYELVHVFRTVYDGEVRPSGELDGGRFWSPDEIRENLGQGVFTPNFEGEAGLILG